MSLPAESESSLAPSPLPSATAVTLRLETAARLTAPLRERIDAVVQAAAAVDGVSAFGEHKWLRLLRGDDRFTALLLWRGAELVGAAHCEIYHTTAPDQPCRVTTELVVHPAHRRRGFGTLLLDGVLALAREEWADELHLWSYGDLLAGQRLAQRAGVYPVRTLLQLTLAAERLPASPPCRADVHLRAFEAEHDAYRWLALHNRVFAGHPEQGRWEPADLQARLEQPWFDPQDLLLAEDPADGTLLGFCWTKLPLDPAEPGEIYIVGVEPNVRGRGLGRFVAEAGLAHIAARGRRGAMLYVEAGNEPALTLYAQLGFQQRWRHLCYARRIAHPC